MRRAGARDRARERRKLLLSRFAARRDRSRELSWIQTGAIAGPTLELASVVLLCANPGLRETESPELERSPVPLSAGPVDAAEADVAGRGVDRLTLPRGRAKAQTVVGGTEVRAPLYDPQRNLSARLLAVGAARGARQGGAGAERAAGPLPDVPAHVIEPV